MQANAQAAGVLYVDGHVRVYHGHQTRLPRHYVTRERLCLRATTDYWVNAMDGRPFFVVNQPVDPGLVQVLETNIIPRLLQDVPNQPSSEQLLADPMLHRFTLAFDSEGYSPELMTRCRTKHIACLTYHKHPGTNWPENEFQQTDVHLGSGDIARMKPAERGLRLPNNLWVRKIRKLSDSGHQTSILITDYRSDFAPTAAAMFAR